MNNLNIILKELFEDNDKELIKKDIEISLRIKERLKLIQESAEYKEIRAENSINASWYKHSEEMKIAGSKSLIALLKNSDKRIQELIVKHNEDKFAKRNAKIVKLLEKEGIQEIQKIEIQFSKDGFNGVYRVQSPNGEKILRIRTIVAWGEIQRPHYRVLSDIS